MHGPYCRAVEKLTVESGNSMAFGLAVYASPSSLPPPTQDSLPAAGQALPDGLSTRKVPTKGFKVASLHLIPLSRALLVRFVVALALRGIGPAAVPALIKALKDGDRKVLLAAAYALAEMRDPAKKDEDNRAGVVRWNVGNSRSRFGPCVCDVMASGQKTQPTFKPSKLRPSSVLHDMNFGQNCLDPTGCRTNRA